MIAEMYVEKRSEKWRTLKGFVASIVSYSCSGGSIYAKMAVLMEFCRDWVYLVMIFCSFKERSCQVLHDFIESTYGVVVLWRIKLPLTRSTISAFRSCLEKIRKNKKCWFFKARKYLSEHFSRTFNIYEDYNNKCKFTVCNVCT